MKVNLNIILFLLLSLFTLPALSLEEGGNSGEDMFDDFDDEETEVSPFQFKGFIDTRYGPRFITQKQNKNYIAFIIFIITLILILVLIVLFFLLFIFTKSIVK